MSGESLVKVPGLDPDEQHLMREDLQDSFVRSHIDPSLLSKFQRVLLTTDGTVTDILEAYLAEQIRLVKLSESVSQASEPSLHLGYEAGTEIISREVLLQGKISRKNFIYAESIIVPERLSVEFQKALLETKTPIGKIWIEQRVETYKEIKDSALESAGKLSQHFFLPPSARLLSRTYCVYSKGLAIMMITEKFPESYFL